jgi:NAD(P)H-hydrate epimerase
VALTSRRNVLLTTVLADAPERLYDIPAVQLGILRRMNVAVSRFDGTLPAHDLLVDALIGYGLEEAPRGATRDLIVAANESAAPAISLDAPSGVDVDTGRLRARRSARRPGLRSPSPRLAC